MVLPQVLPIPQETSLASYDFVDIATGTGTETYQGWSTIDSSGVSYNLIENALATNLKGIATQSGTGGQSEGIDGARENGGTFVQTLDIDFDLTEFQLPRTIRGTGYIDMSYSVGGSSGADSRLIFKIRKWDGSSETEIASVQTQDVGNFDVEIKVSIPITIPQTHFKKGEQLRLTVEGYTKDTGAMTIGADPQDATAGASGSNYFALTNTKLVILIPFKIDL